MLTGERIKYEIQMHAVRSSAVLPSIDKVLEKEDSLPDLQKELSRYQHAQTTRTTLFNGYKLLVSAGLTEEQAIKLFTEDPKKKGADYDELKTAMEEFLNVGDPRRLTIIHKNYSVLARSLERQVLWDDDEEKDLAFMVRHEGLPVVDFFRESIRVRQAHIDLLCMQIDWLKKKRRNEKKLKKNGRVEVIIEKGEETRPRPNDVFASETATPLHIELDEEPFTLAGWQLYTTREFWSASTENLVLLPSEGRAEAVEAYKRTAGGSVSIKPQSVIKAVEFCVSSHDVLSKSLATRLKYGHERTKDWIRLKRGSYRVGIYIPDPDKKFAVFFSGHRSTVYKNLRG